MVSPCPLYLPRRFPLPKEKKNRTSQHPRLIYSDVVSSSLITVTVSDSDEGQRDKQVLEDVIITVRKFIVLAIYADAVDAYS